MPRGTMTVPLTVTCACGATATGTAGLGLEMVYEHPWSQGGEPTGGLKFHVTRINGLQGWLLLDVNEGPQCPACDPLKKMEKP